MTIVDLAEMRQLAEDALIDLPEGGPLSPLDMALIRLGLSASVTTLDREAIKADVVAAFAAGASAAQVQEVVSLVSGLGVHSLMVTARLILEASRGDAALPPLSADEQALWDRHVGDDPFWSGFERELPGFLEAMLRLAPAQFSAFFDYCAVPWQSGTVRGRLKELIAMASDAAPTHRFLPGFRLHLHNAISLGVGRVAILQALDLAAAAPLHGGTR
jgi:hypothetical protein